MFYRLTWPITYLRLANTLIAQGVGLVNLSLSHRILKSNDPSDSYDLSQKQFACLLLYDTIL